MNEAQRVLVPRQRIGVEDITGVPRASIWGLARLIAQVSREADGACGSRDISTTGQREAHGEAHLVCAGARWIAQLQRGIGLRSNRSIYPAAGVDKPSVPYIMPRG